MTSRRTESGPTSTPASMPTAPTTGGSNPFERAPETVEEVEQIRRSVAMLPPGSWAMRREPALTVLAALMNRIRSER